MSSGDWSSSGWGVSGSVGGVELAVKLVGGGPVVQWLSLDQVWARLNGLTPRAKGMGAATWPLLLELWTSLVRECFGHFLWWLRLLVVEMLWIVVEELLPILLWELAFVHLVKWAAIEIDDVIVRNVFNVVVWNVIVMTDVVGNNWWAKLLSILSKHGLVAVEGPFKRWNHGGRERFAGHMGIELICLMKASTWLLSEASSSQLMGFRYGLFHLEDGFSTFRTFRSFRFQNTCSFS